MDAQIIPPEPPAPILPQAAPLVWGNMGGFALLGDRPAAFEHSRWVIRAEQYKGVAALYPAPVAISRTLYRTLAALLASWRRPDGHYWYHAALFAVGADERGTLSSAALIKSQTSGCPAMSKIESAAFLRAFYKIQRGGHDVAALWRVSSLAYGRVREMYWLHIDAPKIRILDLHPGGLEVMNRDGKPLAYKLQARRAMKHAATVNMED